jgi:hypothetical protein
VTIANRGECVPLDVSDKFEGKPSKADVEAMGLSVMASKNVYNPTQTLHVEFARLQDVPDYENFRRLYECNLCDTINVVFPDYKVTEQYKIVKTVWDVLKDRYDSMELGDLSISLSQALGISNSYSGSAAPTTNVDKVIEEGSNSNGSYRKWESGILECWISTSQNVALNSAYGALYTGQWIWTFPVPFISAPTVTCS